MNWYEEGKKHRQLYYQKKYWDVGVSSNPNDYVDFVKGLFGYWPLTYCREECAALQLQQILDFFCGLKFTVRKAIYGLYAVSISQKEWDKFLAIQEYMI